MVEQRQEDVNRPPSWTHAEAPDGQMNHAFSLSSVRSAPLSSNGEIGRGEVETIFDFHLPIVDEQEVANLHRQAEYLLDEMDMAAADGAAFEGDGDRSARGAMTGTKWASSQYETAYVGGNGHGPPGARVGVAEAEKHARVLPEDHLPSIRTRPSGAQAPAPQVRSVLPVPSHADLPPPAPESVLSPRRSTAFQAAQPPAPSPASIPTVEVQELEAEIALLYDEVNRLQETRREITGHALSLLREARAIITGQPERLRRAEHNIRQVRTILLRAHESRQRSARYGILLLIYLSFWLAICAGGLTLLGLYSPALSVLLDRLADRGNTLAAHMLPFLWTLVAGGTGGVIGATFSLVVQMRAGQEFDRQYLVRYMIQPVMGVVLALIIYFLSLLVSNALEINFTAYLAVQVIPPLIALPAGLWQEGVYSMLYRVTGVFGSGRRR